MNSLLKAERRIILASALLVLLTGILVSFAATIPMYRSVRIQIEETSLANARARMVSIENQLDSYQHIAEQFSSRTEIRRRLEAWLANEISLEQLREFSQPRLEEPTSRTLDLAAMFRISNGEVICALGTLANQLQLEALQPVTTSLGFHVLKTASDSLVLVKASAPIRSQDSSIIGYDILYFHAGSLLHHLQGFGNHGDNAKVLLYQTGQQTVLGLLPETGQPGTLTHASAQTLHVDIAKLQQAGIHKTGDAQNRILITQPFARMPLSLLVFVPEQAFYAPAYQDLQGVYMLILVLLVLAIIASRQAIKPLIAIVSWQSRKLEESRAELQLAASVYENTREAIAITDTNLRLLRANHAMQSLCGRNQEELKGELLNQCLDITGHDEDPLYLLHQLGERGRWQGEVSHRAPRDGALRTSLLNVSTVHDNTGAPAYYIHIFSDITARTLAEQKVRHLAAHDALTGLLNRSSILERIRNCIRQQTPFAILFIDLDRFKPVNDRHGHQVGDEILRLASERLRRVARDQDSLARLGGDEFLVILETPAGNDFIERIAADVVHHLSQPFDIHGALIEIDASVGIAYYPEHGETADSIIHAADLAMYDAKRSGGNRYSIADGKTER